MKKHIFSKFIQSLILVLFSAVLIFGSAVHAFAATSYPKPVKNIADDAGVLSESTIRSIQKTNESLDVDVGATIAVCTVSTTGDEDIATFARNVFKEWKLGEGVLLLIAADDENYYFVQSVGVDDVLTNEVLEEIRDEYLEEDFAAGQIDRGVIKCVTKLTSVLNAGLTSSSSGSANTDSSGETTSDNTSKEKGTTIGGVIVGFFKFILYVVLIAIILFVALFIWAMFNDDVAALMQKYIFRRGSSNQFKMPEEYYDDRLYGKRTPQRNSQSNRGTQPSQRRYDAYGNPVRSTQQAQRRPNQNRYPAQNRQNGYSTPVNQQNRQYNQYNGQNQGYGDETRSFTIPNRDSRR